MNGPSRDDDAATAGARPVTPIAAMADQSIWRYALRGLSAVGLSVLLIAVMTGLYALAPEPDVTVTPTQIVVFGAIVVFVYLVLIMSAVVRLQTVRHPVLEGSIAVTALATIIVLGYAWVYLSIDARDPSSFSQPLTKASAVYFTVTVLSTVGFGDIVATTDPARLVVTSQMLVGITVITLGIRLIMQSARQAVQRKQPPAQPD